MDNRTWHDQKPSHPPVPHAVIVAQEHADIAQAVYDQYVEDCLNNPGDPLNWTEIDRLAKIANDADKTLLAARHDALTHGPHQETTEVVMVEYETEIPFGYRVPKDGE